MKCGFQFGFAALCAAFLVSCGKTESPRPANANSTPRPVRVTRAEVRPMERVVHVVGTLAARDQATIAAQVAGQIEAQGADLGDQVKAGQELARIDTTSYEALAAQAAANLSRAEANASNAVQNLKRVNDLHKNNIASPSELDEATAQAAQARAEVKAAEAANAIGRLNLERSRVKAPFDGAVAQRIATVGDYVAIGAPIFRVVKTDPLRLRLEVPERDSMLVREGQTVRVRVEGVTNVYAGKISRVAPAIREGDRMLEAEADIPNPGELRAGLFARAEIVVKERDPAVTVPAKSLVVFAGIEKVVVVSDGKAAEKSVATGRREGDWVEIVSGLDAGETIALDPAGLRTGQPVIIATDNVTANSGGAR